MVLQIFVIKKTRKILTESIRQIFRTFTEVESLFESCGSSNEHDPDRDDEYCSEDDLDTNRTRKQKKSTNKTLKIYFLKLLLIKC